MLRIRGLVLDTAALLGVVAGLTAAVVGYVQNIPDPIERVVEATVDWVEPATTGSILQPMRAEAATGWTNPPRR